jgi:hypothetical protein
MTNFVGLKEHFNQFFSLLKKHGPLYLFHLFSILLAFWFNNQLFTHLLSLEVSKFDPYPTVYAWLLIGLHNIIFIVLSYCLFKLFINLIQVLNSQKNQKSSIFNIFSFWSFFTYIYMVYISIFLIKSLSSMTSFSDEYFQYLNLSQALFTNHLFQIIFLVVIILISADFFTLFKTLHIKQLDHRAFIKKIYKSVYWHLILRILLFALLISLLNFIFKLFTFSIDNYIFIAFLLLFYLTPIYSNRLPTMNISDIKEVKYKRFLKVASYFFLIIILPIFLLLNTIALLNKANYQPIELNHNDLLPSFQQIVDNDNAFVYFFSSEIINNINSQPDNSNKSLKIINENQWDQEYVDQVIVENEELLEHYIYTINNFSYWKNTSNPCAAIEERGLISLSPLRQASRIYNLNILNYLYNDQIDTAWDMTLAKLKFSQTIKTNNDIIDFVSLKSIKADNLKTLNRIISHNDFVRILDFEKIEALSEINFNDKSLLISAIQSEYCNYYYDSHNLFSTLNHKLSYYVNDCNNLIAEYYREVLSAADLENYLEVQEKLPRKIDDNNYNYAMVFEKGLLCRLLSSMHYGVYEESIYRNMVYDILYKFSLINIYVQNFRRQNNSLPLNLSDLNVEQHYLIDTINGQELLYDANRQLLWSVGKNGLNDLAQGDDIVLDLKTGLINYY